MSQFDFAEHFLKSWDKGDEHFELKSSGSTGEPKTILLERKWMEWSAKQTAKFIQPQSSDKMLCCLPLNRVGGLMMLVRAKIWNIPIDLVPAGSNPLESYSGDANIVSFTPYQLYHVMMHSESKLNSFREVLIGGSEMPLALESKLKSIETPTTFRQSYGMTETYSHIALRILNGKNASDWFRTFDDVHIKTDDNHCAVIYAPFAGEGLITNDIVELKNEHELKVLGRKDFTINSGGVKIQIEALERRIMEIYNINSAFVISSKKDLLLGERVVLVTENTESFNGIDWQALKLEMPYGVPKEIIEIKKLPVNEGAKYDRMKIKAILALDSNSN